MDTEPTEQVIVLDHCLQDESNHCATFIKSLARSCPKLAVYAQEAFRIGEVQTQRVFRHGNFSKGTAYPKAQQGGGFLAKLRFRFQWLRVILFANAAYGKDLLRQLEPGKRQLCIPTNVDVRQLLALVLIAACFRRQAAFAVYFTVAPLKSLSLVGKLCRVLGAKRIRFFAENMAMSRTYSQYLGQPCQTLFFPMDQATQDIPERPERHLLFIGQPRREKGFAELVQALECCLEAIRIGQTPITVQADESIVRSEGLDASLDRLKELCRDCEWISIVNGPMERETYCRLIGEASHILIPYHLEAYALRGALVPIEALYFGRTQIISRGLMVSEVVEEHGEAIWMEAPTPDAIAAAIRGVLEGPPQGGLKNRERLENFREMASPRYFLDRVCESLGWERI